MATGLFEVQCPCCEARLKIDPETQAVISHKIPEKKPLIEDLASAVLKLKGESGRREELFQKSMAAEKQHGKVLERKFEELFKQVQDDPDKGKKPIRDFDLD